MHVQICGRIICKMLSISEVINFIQYWFIRGCPIIKKIFLFLILNRYYYINMDKVFTSIWLFSRSFFIFLFVSFRWTEGWNSKESSVSNQEIFRANSIPGLAVLCNLISEVYCVLSPRDVPEGVSRSGHLRVCYILATWPI